MTEKVGRKPKFKGRPPWLEGGYVPKSRGRCEECKKNVYKKPYYYKDPKTGKAFVFHQHCFRVWFKRQVKEGKV